MFACSTPRKELADSGLFGEHSLNRIEQSSSNSGRIDGGLFFGITGRLNTESMIQFDWEPKPNEIIHTSLPKTKFKFIIDDSKKSPTIEFIFSSTWADDPLGGETIKNHKDEINFNDLISEYLGVAKVRISRTDLEKEIYLPRVN